MKTLVTGAAGFIGSHVCRRLCDEGYEVVGIDNLDDYYDVTLKLARLELIPHSSFRFHQISIVNTEELASLVENEKIGCVIHLAAQAGVRYSVEAPMAYGESNLIGFLSILEVCRKCSIKHLIYASSSSVYGLNDKMPFSTIHNVDHPVSLYAATKKSNELIAHSYSQMYGLPTTGLRFFSVYGPWCRPDMAFYKFTKAIVEQRPIGIFNEGDLYRDFTYIDDVVEAILRIQNHVPELNKEWLKSRDSIAKSSAPYQIFNVGCGYPIRLTEMIDLLEKELGLPAIRQYQPMQVGEVHTTYSDTKDLFEAVATIPKVTIQEGVSRFIHWYKSYHS